MSFAVDVELTSSQVWGREVVSDPRGGDSRAPAAARTSNARPAGGEGTVTTDV